MNQTIPFAIGGLVALTLVGCGAEEQFDVQREDTLASMQIVPTSQQLQYWEGYLAVRIPPDAVTGMLVDAYGRKYKCILRNEQSAFKADTMARAIYSAYLVDSATAAGSPMPDSLVQTKVNNYFATNPYPYMTDLTNSQIQAALNQTQAEMAADLNAPAYSDPVPGPDPTAGQDDVDATDNVPGSCAASSVPVLVKTTDEIAAAGSLVDFIYRLTPGGGGSGTEVHEYGSVSDNGTFQGGRANIHVTNPYVQHDEEFSLAQMWASRGSGENLQTVEAGWQEYDDRTNYHSPVIFVYSTSDGYDDEGCYDNGCGRYVQLSSSIAPGMTFSTFSTAGGSQYSMHYRMYRGSSTGNWYIRVGSSVMGYYPGTLFDSAGLGNNASRIDFGGETAWFDDGSGHTLTDIGSGYVPTDGWPWASYARNMMSKNNSNVYVDFDVDWSFDEPGCYEVDDFVASNWGEYIYFGGEGYDAVTCP